MIIFFNKKTGDIGGIIDGRIHPEVHLNMWIGDKKETDRIVCNWKAVKTYYKRGVPIASDFEPESEQKDIFILLDKQPSLIKDYKIDLETKKLILK